MLSTNQRIEIHADLITIISLHDQSRSLNAYPRHHATFRAEIGIPFSTPHTVYSRHYPAIPPLKFPYLARFKKTIQHYGTDHIKTVIFIFYSD